MRQLSMMVMKYHNLGTKVNEFQTGSLACGIRDLHHKKFGMISAYDCRVQRQNGYMESDLSCTVLQVTAYLLLKFPVFSRTGMREEIFYDISI
jgi:hypothetical protein